MQSYIYNAIMDFPGLKECAIIWYSLVALKKTIFVMDS